MLGRVAQPSSEDTVVDFPLFYPIVCIKRYDPVRLWQLAAATFQQVFDRFWISIERVDFAISSDNSIMPKTMLCIDLP